MDLAKKQREEGLTNAEQFEQQVLPEIRGQALNAFSRITEFIVPATRSLVKVQTNMIV